MAATAPCCRVQPSTGHSRTLTSGQACAPRRCAKVFQATWGGEPGAALGKGNAQTKQGGSGAGVSHQVGLPEKVRAARQAVIWTPVPGEADRAWGASAGDGGPPGPLEGAAALRRPSPSTSWQPQAIPVLIPFHRWGNRGPRRLTEWPRADPEFSQSLRVSVQGGTLLGIHSLDPLPTQCDPCITSCADGANGPRIYPPPPDTDL